MFLPFTCITLLFSMNVTLFVGKCNGKLPFLLSHILLLSLGEGNKVENKNVGRTPSHPPPMQCKLGIRPFKVGQYPDF